MALIQELASGVILGATAFGGMIVLLFVMQTAALVAEGRRVGRAVPRAAGRTWAVLGALVTAGALVLQNGFGALDVLTNSIATAPLAASNLVTAGLGLLGMQGYLSDVAFMTGAVSFALFTVVMREVRG